MKNIEGASENRPLKTNVEKLRMSRAMVLAKRTIKTPEHCDSSLQEKGIGGARLDRTGPALAYEILPVYHYGAYQHLHSID